MPRTLEAVRDRRSSALPAVFAPLLLCSQAFVLVRDPSVRRSQARRVRVAQIHTSYRVCLAAQMGQPHERTVMV